MLCKRESTEGWPFGVVKKGCPVTTLGSWQALKACLQPQFEVVWSELEAQESSDMPSVPQVLTSSTSSAVVLSSQYCHRDTKKKVFRAVKDRWFRAHNINNQVNLL